MRRSSSARAAPRFRVLLLCALWVLAACTQQTPPAVPTAVPRVASAIASGANAPAPDPPRSTPRATLRGTLTVFAAASLTEAFSEIGDLFMAHYPDVAVVQSFAGSQQLAQQIGQGAPGDVFAAANHRQMEAAVASGRIDAGAVTAFAQNRLVVVVAQTAPGHISALEDLAGDDIKIVLAAPEVPVGAYSQDFLEQAAAAPELGPAYVEQVRANVVSYEQNVRAVLSKVVLGEADAGIVYTSDLAADLASDMTVEMGEVQTIEIPDALNTIARYPLAVLNDAENPAAAQAFVAFVRAAEGQEILAKYGFGSIPAPAP